MIPCDDLEGALDLLCPMHLLLDDNGRIRQAGPTLRKLRPASSFVGQMFLEVFDLNRPKSVTSFEPLMQKAGTKLHLTFRDHPQTELKGVLVPRRGGRGAIVNLSFGISILDAVKDYALNSSDFSATDLTVELLYLVEAKSAAMEALRGLNLRLQGARQEAEKRADTDALTGLSNRGAADQKLRQLVQMQSRFAVMHLDLDFFKAVNDSLGHAAGDVVLQHVAQAMSAETRASDMVARVGGDEFLLIFDRVVSVSFLNAIAKRLIAKIEEPIVYGDKICRVSASAGTALWDGLRADDPARLLREADVALYAAKKAGRGRHFVFDDAMLERSDALRFAG